MTVALTKVATGNTRAVLIQWTLANGDDGEAVAFSQYADKSVQVTGTFGVAGSVRFEGSNDGGANWEPLTDVQGNNLDFAAPRIKQVTEVTGLVRPRVTGGDGTTSLTVSLCMRES